MDGSNDRETWYMLRCAGGVQNNNNEIINRTTLRFRPIAPKPVPSGTVSGTFVDNKNLLPTIKRSKRKYVRVHKNNGCKRKNKNKNNTEGAGNHHEDGSSKNVVTLQLLPEKPTPTKDQEYLSLSDNSNINNNNLDLAMSSKLDDNRRDRSAAIWLNFKGEDMINDGVSDQTIEVRRRRVTVVESWVTVECVTDTTRGSGFTDEERMKIDLENDTCPGFISDGLNRILWVNESYKKLVMNGDDNVGTSPDTEIMVWLVIKEKLPSLEYSGFTIKARLEYTGQKEKCSKMVPCDVFRMDGGRFAWRLDVEAALSLGR